MSPRWNPNPDVRTVRHVVYDLHVHLVFVTKYRRRAMTGEMLTRCEEIMREVCEDFEAELNQFDGEEDHVRRHLWGGHFWSGPYFAGSCGGAPPTVVRQYIENQQRPL
ncbi:transposase IS200-family protein [Streptomyces coelicoflavus ZG0656]|nr:transposase IS200-family protein [Streptomyces coelicoflavus ZG0656]MZE43764.1 IS200/IS605 family transposase [Streptomyces sp. SID5477]